MLAWLLTLSLTGLGPIVPEGLAVAPVDVVAGSQTIALRAPLVARTPGARLVLFVRDLSALKAPGMDRVAAFEHALPPGSVSARLRSPDGRALELQHTAYLYHRGLAGLVLTESAPGQSNTLYATLEVEASRPLPGVQFIWLDALARDVRDTHQLR
ncbi:MAG: hypothetical protein WD928_15000 [Gammaproteobacteria bacterium]